MINIRETQKDEVEVLQNLNDEVFIDNQKYDPDLEMSWAVGEKGREYFTNLLNDPKSYCLIAEEEGKPVGYIALGSKKFDYRKSKYIEIQNMGVILKYRSKGIGAELIKKGLDWARSKGYDKAFVNSYFKNTNAIKFYKRSGFSEIDLSLEKNI